MPVGTISYQHHLTHPSVLAPGVGLFFVERGLLSLVENLAAQSSLVFLSLEVGLTERSIPLPCFAINTVDVDCKFRCDITAKSHPIIQQTFTKHLL